MRRIIFHINGGIGRCICFTGVLNRFKELNPDVEVNVLTSNPEIFFNNPNINRIYPFNTPYLFEDVVSKMEYIEPEPYKMKEYYADKKHIINCFNIQINGEDEFIQSKIFFTDVEEQAAKEFVKKQKREVIFFQPFGKFGGREVPDESRRSLQFEFAKSLALKLNVKYDLFLIKEDNQKGVDGINALKTPIRNIMCASQYVKGVIGCDSFLQHACAAVDKPAFVFFTTTREENLGYDVHKNYRNGQECFWSPIRILSNDPNSYSKNNGIDKFDEQAITECFNFIEDDTKDNKLDN